MNTLTEENYLKAIFHLINEKNEVTVNDLSRFLKIKMPSVNSMMKKFAEKKWVEYESYKPLKITNSGRKEASLIVRKHRLTEMFLAEKMGFGWEEVHEVAEHIEHLRSDKFFEKMDELLDYPKTDPHGSPIPDKFGNIIQNNFFKLSECRKSEKVIFTSVTESSEEFLKFLNNKNLSLDTEIKIIDIEDFDKSMTISYNEKSEVFSRMVCEKILVVKKLNDCNP